MIVTFGDQPPVYAKPRKGIQKSSTPYPVQRKYLSFLNIHMKILLLKNTILYSFHACTWKWNTYTWF